MAWKSHLSRSTENVRGNYSDSQGTIHSGMKRFVDDYIICVEGHRGVKPAPGGNKGGTDSLQALERLSRFQTTQVGKNVPGSYIPGCFRRSPPGEGHARERRIYGQLVETIAVKSEPIPLIHDPPLLVPSEESDKFSKPAEERVEEMRSSRGRLRETSGPATFPST